MAIVIAPPSRAVEPLSPKVDQSINNGLAYLVKNQNADGSFDGGAPKAAMTGLSLMSLLAAGHAPDLGRYGLNVRRAEEYLVKQVPADGYVGRADGSRMYGHGIITLALSECCGVEADPARQRALRAAVVRCVDVILKAQDITKNDASAGGWRYEPASSDSDLSLSGWNALALRSAQGIGIDVGKDRAGRAVQYVLKCFKKDEGGFGYQPGYAASQAMTGVAVLNLYLMDAADRPEVAIGSKYLLDKPVNDQTRLACYATYYVTQAAFQAGEPAWTPVWKITQDRLLQTQMPDGGWPQSRSGEEPGRIYATNMAVLSLTVPYRLLPVYQR